MADDAGKNVVTLGHWEALKRKQGKEQAVPVKAAKDPNELTRIKNPSGIVASLDNAKRAIQRFGIKFRFNLFRQRVEIEGYEEGLGETLDDIELKVRDLVNEELGFDPEPKYTRDAIRLLAMQNAYDPVKDYLNGLKWDGVKRLDTWLRDYVGAADDGLTRAIGRAVLVAGVRRVRRPGCKFDFVMVLEGPQGGGKSTLLKVLAGGEEYFSDEILVGEDYKAQQELLRGKWIVEIPELAGLSGAEVRKVKAFVSKTHDRARGAFQRSVEEAPRRCIMIGTTNDSEYLKDQTGNRRFWPVAVGKIDLAGLREVRDQLWAEAAAEEPEAADPITIPEDLWGEAAKRQAERVAGDLWDELLEPELSKVAKPVEDELRITAGTVFEKVLKMEPKLVRRHDTVRLADCMRRLGWTGPKAMRIDGALVKGYVREVGMAGE
ncbi:virulence protein E [Rhizobium sp. Root1203]|uniref:virulence-associated E family protein n=1 Tax=Rhizobium sp. Root1203 TaxID=1736427 RepID=UPI00071003FD|nr:virulence-associated E family protein [Rhizobium sp. Root1203]KQV14015.1 virulence protein E [Rhizobium sp. Root1203]